MGCELCLLGAQVLQDGRSSVDCTRPLESTARYHAAADAHLAGACVSRMRSVLRSVSVRARNVRARNVRASSVRVRAGRANSVKSEG